MTMHAIKSMMLLCVAGVFLVSVCAAEPQSEPVDAVAAAQAQVAAQPMNWRAFNALGIALFNARRYESAAGAFEQAIAVFPISMAAESEQQAKEARQRAFEAQQEAAKEAQAQQQRAQKEMQDQQLLSGLFGLIPMMPGANINTQIMSQMGQTMVNSGMMSSSGGEPLLPGMMMENESSQVLRTRELAALHTNLGLTRMALREDDTAIEAFRQAYAMDASRVDLLFTQAKLLQRNDVGSALPLYVRYLELAPKTRQPATWIEIAAVYLRLGLDSETRNALAAARKTWDREVGRSTNANTERAFGKLLSTAGFYKEALNPLQTWVSTVPEDGAVQREWAIALFSAGRIEEARDAMKKSISATKSAPSNDEFTTYFMGMSELHLGRVDEAIKILGTLHPSAETKKTPGFIAAAHALCGHVDEEKDWINRVENGQSDPDTAAADWYRLGSVWFVEGNLPRAAECISRCLELQPGFGPALRLQEQLMNGNAERVKSERSKVVASRDNITATVQRLSVELSNMPMGTSWMALAREGMGYVAKLPEPLRMPKEAQKHFLRAQAILKNAARPGEIREAISEYRWALRYAPLSPEIHLHLSSVYATQKQFSQALRHIETCLAGFQPSEKLDAIIARYYELQYLEERAQRNIRAIRPNTGA
ncbi:MAG: tetratricopeptide repeat protein [Holophaga sp.]|nr:tetratricopeptide repeat protein [Holophaga sp.]